MLISFPCQLVPLQAETEFLQDNSGAAKCNHHGNVPITPMHLKGSVPYVSDNT
jgi:hypothetical protein